MIQVDCCKEMFIETKKMGLMHCCKEMFTKTKKMGIMNTYKCIVANKCLQKQKKSKT
jgi:hypothetical protein